MKFIHTSDFHLCRNMSKSQLPANIADEHRKQLFKTFKTIANRCLKDEVDIWLIAGDFFEIAYTKASDVKRISEVFETIPNTRVFISCGNHDPLYADSFYNTVLMPDNVTIFPNEMSCITIEELKTAVYGFSWSQNSYDYVPFEFPKLNHQYINLLCLHCDVNQDGPYMSMQLSDLASAGFDYAALGHVHKYTNLGEGAIYCGSPEPLDFGEIGRHGFIYGDFSDKGNSVKFISTASRKFVTYEFDVSGIQSYKEFITAINDALKNDKNNIVRIKFKGYLNSQIDLTSICDEIKEDFYCILFINETSADYDIKSVYKNNKDNIIGRYISRLYDEAENDPVAREALRIGLEALLEHTQGGRK